MSKKLDDEYKVQKETNSFRHIIYYYKYINN